MVARHQQMRMSAVSVVLIDQTFRPSTNETRRPLAIAGRPELASETPMH